jgi:hypothetical protein
MRLLLMQLLSSGVAMWSKNFLLGYFCYVYLCLYFALLSVLSVMCICVPHLRAGFLPAFECSLIRLL